MMSKLFKGSIAAFVTVIIAVIMATIIMAMPVIQTGRIAYASSGAGQQGEEVNDIGSIGLNDNESEHGSENNSILNVGSNHNLLINENANDIVNENAENPQAPAQGTWARKWSSADSVAKNAALGYGIQGVAQVNDMLIDIVNKKGMVDYPKHIIGIAKQIGAAAATVYSGSPAAGQAVVVGVDSILQWFHLGETSQTEFQILESRLNDQFDRLSQEIDGVKRDVADLSTQVDRRVADILSKMDDSFEAYYAKTQVTDFMYSTSGNFSYSLIRDYLYSSDTQYSLYMDLATALAYRADDKTVKELYDRLYYALMHYDTASGVASNLDRFTEYYIGGNNRLSIAQYYYDYLKSNQSYVDENAGILSADFAAQVYFDYITALNVVKLITTYQLAEIIIENDNLPKEELKAVRYYYGTGANDYVTVADIETRILPDLELKAQNAYKQMLKDLEYVTELSSSYLVKEVDGKLRYATDNTVGTFGNVVTGETIYLNQVTSPLCNRFALDATLFEYEFKSGSDILVEDKKLGYYTVANRNFTGSVIYNGTVLYTINFRVNDNTTYAGGKGTVDDPYIIATTDQYKLMYNETKNDKSFYLIADLDFNDTTLRPLGSEINPYTGVFNGGGHVIKKVKVDYASENAASLFGVIGSAGVIKYLELDGIKVNESKENNAKKISTGIIAGTNNGTIYSCFIKSSSVKAERDSDENNNNLNKPITMYVGAIAGENNGIISHCKVESTSVTAYSKRFYAANKDEYNQNNTYTGGVVGANNWGLIENCYVASTVSVKAECRSNMEEGLSFRYPYMVTQAGGIAGVASSMNNIKNVYSEVTDLTAATYCTNEAWSGGSFRGHAEEKTHKYVAGCDDKQNNSAMAKSADTYKIASQQITVSYKFTAAKDPEFDCSKDLVYVGTDTSFRLDNLELTLTMKDGDKETKLDSALSVIGIYGFDAINHDKTNFVKRTLTLNLYDSLNKSAYMIEIGYYVKKNDVYKFDLPEQYINTFDNHAEVPTDVFGALGINEVMAVYHDGERVNIAQDVTFTVDTSELGLVKGKLTYNTLEKEIDCNIVCNQGYDTENVEIIKAVLSEDKETCTLIGYKKEYCSNCGKMQVENINREFPVVIRNVSESTCSIMGYTGDLYIEADGTVLKEDMLIERGVHLPLNEHNFDYSAVNVNDYRDAHCHCCINCGYQENHMFRTIENDNKVICECVVCGYQTELEINSREDIERLPRIVVSNAYAVESTREVKVYIDLHANTGITAANFSVNFDPSLTLLSYRLGEILNGRDTIDAFKEYNDHINVTLVQSGTDTKSDGTVLTLTFGLPANPALSSKYVVEVTNKDNEDKFTDKNGNKTDFIAYAGGIIIVSHLPGDINGDNVVNLVDAVILSNYIALDASDRQAFIDHMTELNDKFDISYGDVNLDGGINISDAVQILRYTTGGYETTFVSSVFEVVLNYNDGSNTQESFFVKYGDGYTFGSLQGLPELTKVGYKFAGWFTDFEGRGIRVTNDTPVFYNTNQYKQALYAHFVLNTVSFDANGGMGAKPTLNYQSTFDLSNTYNDYYSYLTKESAVNLDGNGVGMTTQQYLTHTFLGWALTPDGAVAYTEDDIIDLSVSGYNGVGNLVLYAVWSEESIDAYAPEVDGYTFLGWTGADKKTVIWAGDTAYPVNSDITLYAKWRKNTFSFTYNGVNDQTHTETISRDINNYTEPLWANEFIRSGYDFLGWSLTEGGTEVDLTNACVMTEQQVLHVMEYIDNYGIVNLYAVWRGHNYTIAFDKNSDLASGTIGPIATHCGEAVTLPSSSALTPEEHKHFKGWSVYPSGAVIYADGATVIDLTPNEGATVTLYAQWEYDQYHVYYTMAGALLCEDVVSYGSSYTFRNTIEGLDNYSILTYSSESYEPGRTITWTGANEMRDINLIVVLLYDKDCENPIFEFERYEPSLTARLTYYNGPTTGTLIIPDFIKHNDELYIVNIIGNGAFRSTATKQMHFDMVIIPGSVEAIHPYAFFETQADKVYMTNNTQYIYGYAFSNMLYVDDFVLSKASVTNVFFGTQINNLFFYGSVSDWERENRYMNYQNLYIKYNGGSFNGAYHYWDYVNGVITILN